MSTPQPLAAAEAEPFVRPDVAAFLRFVNAVPGPRLHEMSAVDGRRLSKAATDVGDLKGELIAVRRDLAMPGPDGQDIPLRLFDTRTERGTGPVITFFHGGGWVLGDLDSYSGLCTEIARTLDLPVVSVDYRLAPEHPWPAGPDDCEAAARWIAGAPAVLGLTPTSLILAGDSAGGALSITTAIALRDAPAAVPVIAHWAAYPAADMTERYASYSAFGEGYLLTKKDLRWFNDHYQPDPTHWRSSPMLADLAGLPPALVTTASLDPIRDQGRAYAAALARSGVTVTFREAHGSIHGFLTLRRAIPSAKEDLAEALAALKALIAETEKAA